MEDDVLSRVIAVEKEIQACLEAERAKAAEWLEDVRKEAEEEFAKGEEQIRVASGAAAEKARDEAQARAGQILKDAKEKAERLMSLSDETLRGVIMRRLDMILPE